MESAASASAITSLGYTHPNPNIMVASQITSMEMVNPIDLSTVSDEQDIQYIKSADIALCTLDPTVPLLTKMMPHPTATYYTLCYKWTDPLYTWSVRGLSGLLQRPYISDVHINSQLLKLKVFKHSEIQRQMGLLTDYAKASLEQGPRPLKRQRTDAGPDHNY